MLATRVLIAGMVLGLGLLFTGCGRGGGGDTVMIVGGAKNATEERSLTAPHVPGSGIDVHTPVGFVEVVADPSAKEVQITAKVSAFGDTDEEAKARLKDVQVKVSRRDDKVLEVRVAPPEAGQLLRGGCSFVLRVPGANGCTARTGNGSVTLQGLGGPADVHTSVGSVTVAGQGGKVTAKTGNGAVQVLKALGDVHATTAVGPVTVREATGTVKAESGNGTLEITKAGGDVEARSSVGSVTVREAAGTVTAHTGNGAVTVALAKGAVNAKSSVGPVTLEQVSGQVEALTGNGSLTYAPAAGSDAPFSLRSSVGSVTVRLPASVGGSIQAATSVGSVTVNGARQPRSVTGERTSKRVVLTEQGPTSSVHTGNGTITITLE